MISEYIIAHRRKGSLNIPAIVCKDGFTMSVQASDLHYCTPRRTYGSWTRVEVGYPSIPVPQFVPYAEDANFPTSTVYGYVPVEIVEAVIEEHGGMA